MQKTILQDLSYRISMRLISLKCINLSYLAGFQYLKHQRQPLRDELLCVLFFLNGLEFLQQALDEGSPVLLEGCSQGLQPCVQRPGNT